MVLWNASAQAAREEARQGEAVDLYLVESGSSSLQSWAWSQLHQSRGPFLAQGGFQA